MASVVAVSLAGSWVLLGWWIFPAGRPGAGLWSLGGFLTLCAGLFFRGRLFPGRYDAGPCQVPMALAAVVCLSGALAGLFGQAALPAMWQWALLWVLLCLPAGAGAAWRQRGLARAARELDETLCGALRISTAWQLRGGQDRPAQRCVQRQALEVLRAHPPGRWSPARWTRAGFAGALISLILLAAAAYVATPVAQSDAFAARLSGSLDQLNTAERMELAREMLRRARNEDPPRAELLRQAAQAVEDRESRKLREALDQLARSGVDLEALAGNRLAGALGERASDASGETSDVGEIIPRSPREPEGGREEVLVYHRSYEDAPGRAQAGSEGGGSGRIEYTSSSSAWLEARRRATDALRTEAVPYAYRDWVRRYFRPVP